MSGAPQRETMFETFCGVRW
ncbi:hypothetical protein VTH82DRAFT_2462 [Thermothelomyces myriococcoides]